MAKRIFSQSEDRTLIHQYQFFKVIVGNLSFEAVNTITMRVTSRRHDNTESTTSTTVAVVTGNDQQHGSLLLFDF